MVTISEKLRSVLWHSVIPWIRDVWPHECWQWYKLHYEKNKATTHKSGKIIYGLVKHDNLFCNNCLYEMSSEGWLAQFRTALGRDQKQGDWHFCLPALPIQKVMRFTGSLWNFLLSDPPFPYHYSSPSIPAVGTLSFKASAWMAVYKTSPQAMTLIALCEKGH